MRAFVHVIAPAFQLGERKLASRARGQLAWVYPETSLELLYLEVGPKV